MKPILHKFTGKDGKSYWLFTPVRLPKEVLACLKEDSQRKTPKWITRRKKEN